MKGFDVLKVKSGVKNHNKFNLSRAHLTTMNFGEIIPLFNEETVPGDKFQINANYFSRMAPLAKPTYGKFSFKTVAGFVPYHQIAWDSDAWLAGKTTWEGQTPHGRYFTLEQLNNFIWNYCATITTGVTATNCEYSYVATNGTTNYRKFSPQGKYWVKILNALGYALPQGVDMQSTSTWFVSIKDTKLSAYPLLAYFKLYNDYMSQSQRFNTSALSNFLQCVKYGKTVTGYTPSTGSITYVGMKTLFDNLFLNYENDYFTSAWQNPNTPLNALENVGAASQVDQVREGFRVGLNDTYLDEKTYTSGGTEYASISQRALDFLKGFDAWVRRNNYSGSRAVQQIYSRFGIKTDDYRSHYANIISTDSIPVQVGDITATSDTQGSNLTPPGVNSTTILGSYAGKGIMSDGKSISVHVSDYGLVLILGYFTVSPMMSFGFDRKVLRSDPLDYYNPEFDGVGVDAIPLMEVYENPRGIAESDTTEDTDIFGYTERYNSYRYGRDQITGEFRDFVNSNTTAAGMNVWHTGRFLGDIRKAGGLVAQSSSMNTLPQTDSEYNRIFSYTLGDVDHFYLTCQFGVDALRPMMNLNQVPRLGEGDTIVPRNGNVIS